MNRIETRFNRCKLENRTAFVAYITAGDPDFKTSLKIVDELVKAGVDVLELGIPFSDPLADGEANQLASERSISSGMTPLKVLDEACEIRGKHPELPLVLFTYLNPIAYSKNLDFAEFCKRAVISGIDAILPLDLPPEDALELFDKKTSFQSVLKKTGLPLVSLVAPTTPHERIKLLAENAGAFVYYVSKEGVTGESKNFSAKFADRITEIKKYTELPVVVGFGISSPEHVKAAAATGVDGVVVGSAIVRKVEALAAKKCSLEDIGKFVKNLKRGLK